MLALIDRYCSESFFTTKYRSFVAIFASLFAFETTKGVFLNFVYFVVFARIRSSWFSEIIINVVCLELTLQTEQDNKHFRVSIVDRASGDNTARRQAVDGLRPCIRSRHSTRSSVRGHPTYRYVMCRWYLCEYLANCYLLNWSDCTPLIMHDLARLQRVHHGLRSDWLGQDFHNDGPVQQHGSQPPRPA